MSDEQQNDDPKIELDANYTPMTPEDFKKVKLGPWDEKGTIDLPGEAVEFADGPVEYPQPVSNEQIKEMLDDPARTPDRPLVDADGQAIKYFEGKIDEARDAAIARAEQEAIRPHLEQREREVFSRQYLAAIEDGSWRRQAEGTFPAPDRDMIAEGTTPDDPGTMSKIVAACQEHHGQYAAIARTYVDAQDGKFMVSSVRMATTTGGFNPDCGPKAGTHCQSRVFGGPRDGAIRRFVLDGSISGLEEHARTLVWLVDSARREQDV